MSSIYYFAYKNLHVKSNVCFRCHEILYKNLKYIKCGDRYLTYYLERPVIDFNITSLSTPLTQAC